VLALDRRNQRTLIKTRRCRGAKVVPDGARERNADPGTTHSRRPSPASTGTALTVLKLSC
jgi:hypothetical protein